MVHRVVTDCYSSLGSFPAKTYGVGNDPAAADGCVLGGRAAMFVSVCVSGDCNCGAGPD